MTPRQFIQNFLIPCDVYDLRSFIEDKIGIKRDFNYKHSKVYVGNPMPDFFDLSYIYEPADRGVF